MLRALCQASFRGIPAYFSLEGDDEFYSLWGARGESKDYPSQLYILYNLSLSL
jgi:hypothetical protein